MTETLKIGDVARRAGVSVDTVRFYEAAACCRPRLVARRIQTVLGGHHRAHPLRQAPAGARVHPGRGRRRARRVDGGIATCEREQPRFETVLARIDQKIADLAAIRRNLVATLRRCRDGTCTPARAGPRRGPTWRPRAARPDAHAEAAMTAPVELLRSGGLFVATAIAEYVGCFLPYLWLRSRARPGC